MGSTHFLTRGLAHVGTEMSLYVLAYNLKRVIKLLRTPKTLQAMRLLGAGGVVLRKKWLDHHVRRVPPSDAIAQ